MTIFGAGGDLTKPASPPTAAADGHKRSSTWIWIAIGGAVLAGAVSELDPDHHHSGRGELIAPARKERAGSLEDHHAATVQVQHSGQ